MRVLVTSTAGAGHFGPLVPVLDALARRGDDVLLVVPPGIADQAAATGHPVRLGGEPDSAELAELWRRFAVAPPDEAAVIANREIFGRLDTAAMLPAVEDACDSFGPNLIVREATEYAAAVAAARRGLAQAQVAISQAQVEASALRLVAPALEPYGADLVDTIHAAPYLTRFPEPLDPSPFPHTYRYRDAVAPSAAADDAGEWRRGDEPLVYVTFGSVAGGLPVGVSACRAALDAVRGMPVRVLLTVGREIDPAVLGPVPPNVHVAAWVPQQDVLAHAAAVVCHAGSGTTFGALAAGVPLVLLPMFADQPRNARLVAEAGAAVVVAPERASIQEVEAGLAQLAPRLRAAIETVLADPAYRAAATDLAAQLGDVPTADEVIAALVPG